MYVCMCARVPLRRVPARLVRAPKMCVRQAKVFSVCVVGRDLTGEWGFYESIAGSVVFMVYSLFSYHLFTVVF